MGNCGVITMLVSLSTAITIGVIAFAIALMLLVRLSFYSSDRNIEARKANLKLQGRRIEVDFNECRFLGSTERREIQDRGKLSMLKGFDSVGGDPKISYEQIDQCIIEYKHKEKGKKTKIFRSEIVFKNEEGVQILSLQKRYTYIYVDDKTREYYFDLSFLSEKA